MPVAARLTGDRLRSGTVVVANITSSYQFDKVLSIQNDQYADTSFTRVLVPWVAPMATPDKIPVRAVRSKMQSGIVREDGFYGFVWTLSYWTLMMYSAFVSYYSLTGSTLSAPVSVMTYDIANAVVYLNCMMDKPFPGADMVLAPGWYQNIKVKFHHGVVIT